MTERRIGVLVPEPNEALLAVARELTGFGEVEIFAPWALQHPMLEKVASLLKMAAFARRRRIEIPHVRVLPAAGFALVDALSRTYARRGAAEGFRARFAVRELAGAWACGWLVKTEPRLTHLFAPSLAARSLFAAAQARAIRCFLLEDLPDLRGLGEDLDRAAQRWPGCPFLRNHRPSHHAISKQRAERCLSEAVGVRGQFAWNRLAAKNTPRLFGWGVPPAPLLQCQSRREDSQDAIWRVLVAGPALGRSGTALLTQAADALPWIRFTVQCNAGLEPTRLLEHASISAASPSSPSGRSALMLEVNAVAAPAAVESHPWEVREALDRGLPVIGTPRALGQVVDAEAMTDLTAKSLVSALERARARTRANGPLVSPWQPPVDLPSLFQGDR